MAQHVSAHTRPRLIQRVSLKHIREGERLPWWGAIARVDLNTRTALILPLGLNLVYRVAYDLYCAAHRFCNTPWHDAREAAIRQDGYRDGYAAGRYEGQHVVSMLVRQSRTVPVPGSRLPFSRN